MPNDRIRGLDQRRVRVVDRNEKSIEAWRPHGLWLQYMTQSILPIDFIGVYGDDVLMGSRWFFVLEDYRSNRFPIYLLVCRDASYYRQGGVLIRGI